VASVPSDWLGVDRRFRGGVCIEANGLGERASLLFALFVLFIALPNRIVVALLPAAVFAACDLGRFSGNANLENQAEHGADSRPSGDGFDDSGVEHPKSTLVECTQFDSQLGT
jgi:hypothetical protein